MKIIKKGKIIGNRISNFVVDWEGGPVDLDKFIEEVKEK